MTILRCNSVDHQIVPTNAGGGGSTSGVFNRKLYDVVAATVPTVDTSVFLHGSASMKFASGAASASSLRHTMSSATGTMAGWARRSTGTPTSTSVYFQATGATSTVDVRLNSSGVLLLTGGAVDGSEVTIHTPTAGSWYWYSVSWDWSANPNVSTVRVYDSNNLLVAIATRSGAVAADTATGAFYGYSAAGHGFDLNIDSYVLTDTYAPVSPRKVQLLTPSNGTHSFTANDFQNQASTNLTTASDIAALVDEFPPSISDFVKQVVIRATGYCEFIFSDLSTTGLNAAEFVQIGIASHPVGTANANTSIVRLNDSGTITSEPLTDMTFAADTLEYHITGYNAAPSTSSSWTDALVNSLAARWGYSDDVTPPPALDGIWLEVVSPFTIGSIKGQII